MFWEIRIPGGEIRGCRWPVLYLKENTVMQPTLAVEYRIKVGEDELQEESIPLHGPEEMLAFVAPGGGCERIPSEVQEIRMMFLTRQSPNVANPLADVAVTLQLGMLFLSGPLSEVVQTAEALLDRAGRGELSGSFLKVIGVHA
jgi:hypothetical protein